MQSHLMLLLVGVMSSVGVMSTGVCLTENPLPEKKTESSIAQLKKNDVEVRINQVQIQRLGTAVEAQKNLKMVVNKQDFTRTIAISISQKGQGTTIGPTHIQLKNGAIVRPFMNGNQRLMSLIANAKIPEKYDFAEVWFQIPKKAKLADIFPLTVVHNTTNKQKEKVEFKFTDIEP